MLSIGHALLAPFAHPLLAGVQQLLGIGAALSGLAGLYFMYRIYRIPARPFWDHWQTAAAFGGNALALGALLAGLIALPILAAAGAPAARLGGVLAAAVVLGQGVEIIGHLGHARALTAGEGSVSWFLQTTRHYWPWAIRNGLLGVNLILAAGLLGASAAGLDGWPLVGGWLLLGPGVIAAAVIGRSLFFVVVIPTTMPGAFFGRTRISSNTPARPVWRTWSRWAWCASITASSSGTNCSPPCVPSRSATCAHT